MIAASPRPAAAAFDVAAPPSHHCVCRLAVVGVAAMAVVALLWPRSPTTPRRSFEVRQSARRRPEKRGMNDFSEDQRHSSGPRDWPGEISEALRCVGGTRRCGGSAEGEALWRHEARKARCCCCPASRGWRERTAPKEGVKIRPTGGNGWEGVGVSPLRRRRRRRRRGAGRWRRLRHQRGRGHHLAQKPGWRVDFCWWVRNTPRRVLDPLFRQRGPLGPRYETC